MKKIGSYVVLSGLLVSLAGVSQAARIHAWVAINPFPLVVVAQPAVVVAQPAVVEDPYAAPPPDYRQILADFHARAQRLQKMLDHQLRKGIISQGQYDRHAADLDGIIQNEQQDAARHNGALTPREVNDLNRRLTELQDRVHEDLAR